MHSETSISHIFMAQVNLEAYSQFPKFWRILELADTVSWHTGTGECRRICQRGEVEQA